MNNNMRAIHPGEILREEYMLPEGIYTHYVAFLLDVPEETVNDLIAEKIDIDAVLATKLAKAYNTSVDYWLNMQNIFNKNKNK